MNNLTISNFLISLCFFFGWHIQAQSFKLVWADEFNYSGLPDTTKWGYEMGFVRNNELQYYTRSRTENCIVKNGMLQLIARKETFNGAGYTSASITTDGKFSLTYGKIEARIKCPVGQGIWPAFWLLGQNIYQELWPKCGEIDIMEHINTENNVHATIHWDNNGHVSSGGTVKCQVDEFHIYAIEWDKQSITWLLDGKKIRKVSIKNNVNSTDEFHKPFYIILNLAIGGNWPGNPDSTTLFPDTMCIDYVRVYQKPAQK